MRVDKGEIFPLTTSIFIALNHYGTTLDKLTPFEYKQFVHVYCKIKNKMALSNLCDFLKIKSEIWSAKNYNVLTNNCQTFQQK